MKKRLLAATCIALLCTSVQAAKMTEELSKTQVTEIFHNMDTQQYTSVWLTPKGNNVYAMHMQCQNGQQVAVFRYTMHIIFRDKDGWSLKVYRQNCDLPGRHGGSNQKEFHDADIDISSIANRVTQVSLWGERRGPSGFWSGLSIRPKSFAELVFPVCWGHPEDCRSTPSVPMRVEPKRYWAGVRVDCIDANTGRPRGDQDFSVWSEISLEDAENQLKLNLSSIDAGNLDLCQGQSGDHSRKENLVRVVQLTM